MYLSVIIPAYKEEKNIESTIRSISSYLKAQSYDFEILVEVDGVKDKTAEIAKNLESEIQGLRVIVNQVNQGKGSVVRRGMLEARGEFRLFTDADNATSIDQFEKMLPFFSQGYDVVIGSIGVKGHTVAAGSEPIWRRLFGKMGNIFIQIVAVPGIYDTQRGFKVLTARAAQAIFTKAIVNRWAFDIEMLALARKFGYKIKEVPVNWKNDPNTGSHPGLSAYFQVLKETLNIRWNLMTGVYGK